MLWHSPVEVQTILNGLGDLKGGRSPVVHMIESLGMMSVDVDGCAFDLVSDGKRPLRPWTIKTTSERLLKNLLPKRCSHPKGFVHDHAVGSLTVKTGVYNIKMAACILSSLFPSVAALSHSGDQG